MDDWGHDRWTVDNFPFRRWRVDGGRWIDWGPSIKQDEDESEDIVENAEKNGNGAKVGGQNNKRGMKRKHDADTKDEPDNKL